MTAEELAEIIAERTPFCPTIEEAQSILAALAVTGEQVGPTVHASVGSSGRSVATDPAPVSPVAAAVLIDRLLQAAEALDRGNQRVLALQFREWVAEAREAASVAVTGEQEGQSESAADRALSRTTDTQRAE